MQILNIKIKTVNRRLCLLRYEFFFETDLEMFNSFEILSIFDSFDMESDDSSSGVIGVSNTVEIPSPALNDSRRSSDGNWMSFSGHVDEVELDRSSTVKPSSIEDFIPANDWSV